ncbi:MAG: response regulator [Bacteriovoracaceae bacterium]|nr:response regulator [Bacteriovoracaceae bacterium]
MKINIWSEDGIICNVEKEKKIYIGKIIDDIPTKIVPFKESIDIKKTLLELKEKFFVNAESIILIDDDEDFLVVSKHYLVSLGHYVEAYNNVEVAYNVFNENPKRFHRIIIDHKMPGMDGSRFLELIGPKASGVKVCILSADINSVPHETSQRHLVIKKPCNILNFSS